MHCTNVNALKRTLFMCLIFIVKNQHPDFPLIIAANRDEFYNRPTLPAHFWEETPGVLAGKDLQSGGTWLGVHSDGYFSALTNIRDQLHHPAPRSRGLLVRDALHNTFTHQNLLDVQGRDYAGFNLITGSLQASEPLYYLNNRSPDITIIDKGIFGLSNAFLNSPWPKVTSGIEEITLLLNKPFDAAEWFAVLQNNTKAPTHLLPDTGIGIEKERLLSSRFIQSNDYGTRTSTIITVNHQSRLRFIERNIVDFTHTQQEFEIDI